MWQCGAEELTAAEALYEMAAGVADVTAFIRDSPAHVGALVVIALAEDGKLVQRVYVADALRLTMREAVAELWSDLRGVVDGEEGQEGGGGPGLGH